MHFLYYKGLSRGDIKENNIFCLLFSCKIW